GVKTGFRVRDARKICPSMIFIENDPAKYRSVTTQIFSLLSEYTDKVEPFSIDEAFMDMTGLVPTWERAQEVAQEIKNRIRSEIGEWLSCSVGISYTRFLSKQASEFKKPDGLTILKPEDLTDFLQKITLLDICGINYKMQHRLNRIGIRTPLDLKNHPVGNILQSLGKYGYYLWSELNGMEIASVTRAENIHPKSIGHSYCIPKQTTDKKYLQSIILKLCEKTARRMREQKLEATTLLFGFRYVNHGGLYKHKKFADPLFSTQCIYEAVLNIFNFIHLRDKVRMLAVGVSGLVPRSNQLPLFFDKTEKQRAIYNSLDNINDRYGEFTIFLGEMHNTEKFANDRIGFRKSVGVVEREPQKRQK
ncbi:MAG: DNA polymerase IV, partial [bacterium]